MSEALKTREAFQAFLREELPAMVRDHPQIFIDALAANRGALVDSLKAAGFSVGENAGVQTADVVRALREAQEDGRVPTGFGARQRKACDSRTVTDPFSGRKRTTYLFGQAEVLAESWFRAYMSAEKVDVQRNRAPIHQIAAELEALVRAPVTPLTSEPGTGGAYLVPTIIAAQIFEEMNERFVLRGLVDTFVSATPLQIPRRTSQVVVSRGAVQTDLTEIDVAKTLGNVKLSPERVGAHTYIDPLLAAASSVGPVRWTIGQIAEALAKDAQRCIVGGDPEQREPRGVNLLPTAGGNLFDRAKTSTWTNTDNASRRDSMRKLFYAIAQFHRESDKFAWVVNNDGMQVLASLNDLNQKPFEDAAPGQAPTYLRKIVVESSSIVTAGGLASVIGGDFNQYAWLESPLGIMLETTTVGGAAWTSHSIGVRAVQFCDGAPVIPQAFGIMPSVNV